MQGTYFNPLTLALTIFTDVECSNVTNFGKDVLKDVHPRRPKVITADIKV